MTTFKGIKTRAKSVNKQLWFNTKRSFIAALMNQISETFFFFISTHITASRKRLNRNFHGFREGNKRRMEKGGEGGGEQLEFADITILLGSKTLAALTAGICRYKF